MSYKGLATLLFGKLADRSANFFSFIKDSLPKTDIKISFRSYMSITFFTTFLVHIISLVAVYFIFTYITPTPFFLLITYLLFIPTVFSLICFFALCFSPYQRKQWKKRNIETNLPFVLTHMGAIAESGVPPSVIFRLISQFEEYGEISKEMKKVVRNIETFGIDPLTAVKEVAKRSPSDEFKQVLTGFVTTTESGGDIKSYLKDVGSRTLFEWRMKRERFVQQLTAYAELYMGLVLAAPIFLICLFSVMNMIPGARMIGQYNIIELMELCIYIFIPLMNIGFLMLLKGVEVEM